MRVRPWDGDGGEVLGGRGERNGGEGRHASVAEAAMVKELEWGRETGGGLRWQRETGVEEPECVGCASLTYGARYFG